MFFLFFFAQVFYRRSINRFFLYLCRLGSWEALKAQVLERTHAAPAEPGARPRRRDLITLPLAFDRNEVDEKLWAIDSATLRPRFQSDLIDQEDRERFDREMEPLAANEAMLVYDPSTAEVRCLSPAAWALYERCDGQRDVDSILEIFPHEAHADAKACLADMAGAGLFEAELMRTS
ncbi:MAG: hypothetical protein AAF387_20885 [Pseudomonadota bacterium]